MWPKYEFTNETITYDGHILHRIRHLENKNMGGFIESEDNLSQDGTCWVKDNAKVYENAKICGFVKILDSAEIRGNIEISDGKIDS